MNSRQTVFPTNNSILHTDTLQESQISITTKHKHYGKHKNFLDALNFVKSNNNNVKSFSQRRNSENNNILNTINSQLNSTTEGLNVSEFSLANAYLSREENVKYNITYDKTMNTLNNNPNFKKFHKKSYTNANIPYYLTNNKDHQINSIKELIVEENEMLEDNFNYDLAGKNNKTLRLDESCKIKIKKKVKNKPTYSFDNKPKIMVKESLMSLNGGHQLYDLDEESDIHIDKSNDVNCSYNTNKLQMKNDVEQIERIFNSKIDQKDTNSNGKNSKNLIVDSINYSSLKLKNEDQDFFTNFNRNSLMFNNNMSKNEHLILIEDSLEADQKRNPIKIVEKKELSKFSLNISNFEESTNNVRKYKRKHQKSDVFESGHPSGKNKKNEYDELSNLNSLYLKSNNQMSLNTKEKNLLKNELTLNISESADMNLTYESNQKIKQNLMDKFNNQSDKVMIISEVDKSYSFQNKNFSKILRNEEGEESIVSNDVNGEFKVNKLEMTRFTSKTESNYGPKNSISIFDINFVSNLIEKEKEYTLEPNFLLQHPSFKSEYRVMLLDWLMELCEEFAFKRDTFHYAVNYIDRYLSCCMEVEKDDLQLIGVVCLCIAAKFEEVQIPRSEEYVIATDNSYTLESFIQTEKIVLKALNWKFLPPTLNLWLNWYLCQWDVYLESFSYIYSKIQLFTPNIPVPFFKRAEENSYNLFRKITQLIDLIILDTNNYLFNGRMIVASAMFLVFGYYFGIFNNKSNLTDLNYLNNICFGISRKKHFLNDIFSEFLTQSFGFQYTEIFFSIIYVSKFMNFQFNYDLPLIIRSNDMVIDECHYEEFLSYQTHNSNNYTYVSKFIQD